MPSKRERIASPNAKKITIAGTMAVPNNYIRLILNNEYEQKKILNYYGAYYTFWEKDADGQCGEVRFTIQRHKDHWLKMAADLRGKDVCITAIVRPYFYNNIHGYVLDVFDISKIDKS